MNEKMHKITLADGTEIKDVRLNGNNFISKSPITNEMFENNCSVVMIDDGLIVETYENMRLVNLVKKSDEYWFILDEISVAELEKIKMQSDIEYLAMMFDVEL